MRTILPVLALTLPLATSGCAITAGAVAGYVLHKETNATNVVAHVTYDYEDVWDVTKEVLAEIGTSDLEVLEAIPRQATTTFEGDEIVVQVVAHDLERTVIEITAERSGLPRPKTAQKVLERIIDELQG